MSDKDIRDELKDLADMYTDFGDDETAGTDSEIAAVYMRALATIRQSDTEIESLRQQLAGYLEQHGRDSAELRRLCAARDEQRDGRLAQAERAAAAESRIAELEQQLAEARAGRVPEAVVALAPSRAGRVYLAGPMTGIEDYNFPAFNAAADTLRGNGHHVENPADHGIVDGAEWPDYLRYDIARLATCETLALLPGWSQSKGARMERHIADALGMSVIYLNDAEQQPPAAAKPCEYCDDTGDVHTPTGEWRGVCVCAAGKELQAAGVDAPVPMVLHCPACRLQHIDKPDELRDIVHRPSGTLVDQLWTNPPHRSHLCHGCGHIWRPADVPTVGVQAVETKGKADSPIYQPPAGGVGLDDALTLLKELREAVYARPSCQMAVIDRCQCVACVSDRVDALIPSAAVDCSNCGGAGECTGYEGSGPDIYEVNIICPHCKGSGEAQPQQEVGR